MMVPVDITVARRFKTSCPRRTGEEVEDLEKNMSALDGIKPS
jgi:hypothetical protein